MTDLFHLAWGRLAPGSIIESGNWGRIIRTLGWGHGASIREMLLEGVRAERFPAAPSRLDCSFAFLTPEEAERFRATTAGFAYHLLYRVEPIDPNAARLVANAWGVAPSLNEAGKPDTPFTPNWPDAYWSGCPDASDDVCREVLLQTGLRVVSLHNP